MKKKLTKKYCEKLYETDHLAHKKLVQDQDFKNLKVGDKVICWSDKWSIGQKNQYLTYHKEYEVVQVYGHYWFCIKDNEGDYFGIYMKDGNSSSDGSTAQFCITLPYEEEKEGAKDLRENEKLIKEYCDELYERDHIKHKKIVQDQDFKSLKVGDKVICWSNKTKDGHRVSFFNCNEEYQVTRAGDDWFCVKYDHGDFSLSKENGNLFDNGSGIQFCMTLPYEEQEGVQNPVLEIGTKSMNMDYSFIPDDVIDAINAFFDCVSVAQTVVKINGNHCTLTRNENNTIKVAIEDYDQEVELYEDKNIFRNIVIFVILANSRWN